MAGWNGSGYRENSSIDEKFLFPKIYYWSTSHILAFIKVVVLKNTEILEYFLILLQALNRWWAVLYVSRSMEWNLVHPNFKPSWAFWPDIGQQWPIKFLPFSQGMCSNFFHSFHSIYHSPFSHPHSPTSRPGRTVHGGGVGRQSLGLILL